MCRSSRPASALTFVGALCARVAASVGDWLVLLGERILFTKAPGIFVPKRAENFGTYGRKPLRFLTEETFSFDLMPAAAVTAMIVPTIFSPSHKDGPGTPHKRHSWPFAFFCIRCRLTAAYTAAGRSALRLPA